MNDETGHVTGTKDKDYNLLWYVEACLSNALRMETYLKDAERDGDDEVAELFRKAQADSRKGAELGKQLLARRLSGTGSGSTDTGSTDTGSTDTGTTTSTGGDTGSGEGTATVPGEAAGTGGSPAPAGDPGALPQDPGTP